MKAYSNAMSVLALLVFALVSSGSAMAQRAGHGGGAPPAGGARPPGGAPPAGGAHPPGGSYGHGYRPAYSHGYGHGYGWGISLGFPLYWPGYYYPGYYGYSYGYPGYAYPGSLYTYPAYSGEYVEQGAAQAPAPAQPQGDWYFCRSANAYYPYVRECPEGWQRVPSVPPR